MGFEGQCEGWILNSGSASETGYISAQDTLPEATPGQEEPLCFLQTAHGSKALPLE